MSGNRFCLIDFLPIMWYTDNRNFGGQNDEIFIRKRDSGALEHLRAQRPQLLRGRSRSRRSSSKQKVKRQPKQVAFWRRRRDFPGKAARAGGSRNFSPASALKFRPLPGGRPRFIAHRARSASLLPPVPGARVQSKK